MVAGRDRIISSSYANIFAAECLPAETALQQGAQFHGIENTLPLIRFLRDQDLGYTDVNVRTAKQSVLVEHTGCIPEHHSIDLQERTVAIGCPKDPADQCETCIMRFEGGKLAMDALKKRFNQALM